MREGTVGVVQQALRHPADVCENRFVSLCVTTSSNSEACVTLLPVVAYNSL